VEALDVPYIVMKHKKLYVDEGWGICNCKSLICFILLWFEVPCANLTFILSGTLRAYPRLTRFKCSGPRRAYVGYGNRDCRLSPGTASAE
jgi:hypothetical protein